MSLLEVRLFLRSFLLQAGFSDERRQGLGFAWALDPALRAAYAGDAAGLSSARARHLGAFNTQPYAAGLVLGVTAALERRAASGEPALAARAESLKSAVGAALAGAADAFFWGCLRPLAAAVAILVGAAGWKSGAEHPFAWGAAAGLLVFNAPALAARGFGLELGLRDGASAAASAAGLPAQRWIVRARLAAVVAVFAAVWIALNLPMIGGPRALAAAAFAAGAGLSRAAGGPLKLIAAAGLLGVAAAAGGWTL